MATKAQQYRSEAQRKGQNSKKKKKTPRGDHKRLAASADTSKPGVSASDRRWGGDHTGERNRSERAAKNATYEFEDSVGDKVRPPRKSTRGSKIHVKTDSSLRVRFTVKARAPSTRAGAAKTTGG